MTDIKPEDIEALVRTFDDSNWDELRVVVDGFEIYLSKRAGDRLAAPAPASRAAAEPPRTAPVAPVAAHAAPKAGNVRAVEIPPGMVAVRAPNLGTFYRAPKPGAPPYVALGETVAAETEICLIEVMKLFTSVPAGVAGIVRKVLAEDAQLVEFDQPLFLIEPIA